MRFKRGLIAVILIVLFLVSIQGVSAAKLIDKKSKIIDSDEYGYQKNSWKTYSSGSNHVVTIVTAKIVYWDYPEYSYYVNYKIDFKKISKTKLKITYIGKYGRTSLKVTTKRSAVNFYKKYYRYYII